MLRPSGRASYVVSAWPLVRARRDMMVDKAAALLVIVDPVAVPRHPVALCRDAFALTACEGQLAQALIAGHSPEGAAAGTGGSLSTARDHLRRLLAKTGTARQADLVRLLARVA